MTGHAFATAEFSPDAFGSSVVPLIERFVATIDDVGADEASAWAEEQRALGAGGEFTSPVCSAASRQPGPELFAVSPVSP